MHQNLEYTIIIFNEVTVPHPQCDQCDRFIPWEALTEGHLQTAILKREEKWKIHFLAAADAQETAGTELGAWEHVLDWVEIFKYLVRILLFDNSDWPSVDGNLWKAQWKLGIFYCMIIRDGADT